MKTYLIAGILIVGIFSQYASAYEWYWIDRSDQCVDCIPVEPNPFAHYSNTTVNGILVPYGPYQVHYLKPGEQPTYFDYNCWGCSVSDYDKIFQETGLWYWPK